MSKLLASFFCPGIPQPGGSKKGFYVPKIKRVVITDANDKAKPWQQAVMLFAKQAYAGEPVSGPLKVAVVFTVPRPKGHFRTGRSADTLKPSAPAYPTTKPDATKLWRAMEDALTAILWSDDAQVVQQYVSKRYGATPGAEIEVYEL
jgi:Holliday junction resolvase RusA-like endonuclease